MQEAESYLSELVSSHQLHAKIDRPARIVVFSRPQDESVLLNDWADNLSQLMGLVDNTCHLIEKEKLQYKAQLQAAGAPAPTPPAAAAGASTPTAPVS